MRKDWKEIADKYSDEELIEAAKGLNNTIHMEICDKAGLKSVGVCYYFYIQALAERLQKANETVKKWEHTARMGDRHIEL